MSRKTSYETVRQGFENVGLILLEEEYLNNKTLMRAKCPIHPDKILLLRYNDIVSGRGCKYCGIERRASKRKTDFNTVKDYFIAKNYELLSTEEDYKSSSTKLKYICPFHPDEPRYITFTSIKNGHGCVLCANEYNAKYFRKDFSIIEEEFKKRNYLLLSKEEDYKNSNSKLEYICPKHPDEIQSITYSNFSSGSGCRYCGNQNSKGENIIKNFLVENEINFTRQKKFEDLRNPKNNYRLSYDFYLPDYNMLIEFQGGYHDGKVHERNPKKQTKEQLENQKFRDKIKKDYAINNGFSFLEIWYTEMKNIEKILKKELNI